MFLCGDAYTVVLCFSKNEDMMMSQNRSPYLKISSLVPHCRTFGSHVPQLVPMSHNRHPCPAIGSHVPQSAPMYRTRLPCPTIGSHVPQSVPMSNNRFPCPALASHVPQSVPIPHHRIPYLLRWFSNLSRIRRV